MIYIEMVLQTVVGKTIVIVILLSLHPAKSFVLSIRSLLDETLCGRLQESCHRTQKVDIASHETLYSLYHTLVSDSLRKNV